MSSSRTNDSRSSVPRRNNRHSTTVFQCFLTVPLVFYFCINKCSRSRNIADPESSTLTQTMRRTVLSLLGALLTLQGVLAFSKYGRSCKDIGCLSNEVCMLAEDPCSRYERDQCGKYPTCVPSGSTSGPSCMNFVCPPTQMCQLDGGTPKCVATGASATHVRPSHNENTNSQGGHSSYPSIPNVPNYPSNQPSYPGGNSGSGGGLYPSLTTSRPAVHGSNYPAGGQGYAGSAPNSGYPGYPVQGYPTNSRNPTSQYPGYNQGYPSQGSGYPGQSGYPNQGYPGYNPQGGYNNPQGGYSNPQGGYNPYGATGNRYGGATSGYGAPQGQSQSNPIVDKITDSLKNLGKNFLKNALNNYGRTQ